jgi:hypothetical protein
MKLFAKVICRSDRFAEQFVELDVRSMTKNMATAQINAAVKEIAESIIDFVDHDGEEIVSLTIEFKS